MTSIPRIAYQTFVCYKICMRRSRQYKWLNEQAPSRDFMRPPAMESICKICRKPLGAEPHFASHYPHGEHGVHLRCQKELAAGEPFPYEQELHKLRDQVRLLRLALTRVITFGKWLAWIRAGWPETRSALEEEFQNRRVSMRTTVDSVKVNMSKYE